MNDTHMDSAAYDSDVQFVPVPTWLVKDEELSVQAKWLWVVLARYASMRHGAIPKRRSLALALGYSKASSVDKFIAELKKAGLVTIEERYENGGRVANHYVVHRGLYSSRPAPRNVGGAETAPSPETGVGVVPRQGRGWSPSGDQGSPQTGTATDRTITTRTSTDNVGGAAVVVADEVVDVDPTAVEDVRDDVESLLDLLDAQIVENGLRPPNRTKGNRNAMRLLLDRDEYTHEQVAFIIRWCQRSPFWHPNIRSATKLREKFQTLVGQMRQEYNKPPAPTAVDRQAGWDDAADELRAMGVQ